MRTTVTLDDDIYEAGLSQARATGQRLGKVLSDMARRALEPEPKGRSARIEVAENCRCRSGCPNCIEPAKSYNISNAAIDKAHGVALANELLSSFERGPDLRFCNGRMVTA
jgi:ATP-dependent helicase YprA (DUF1998 family)